MRVLGSAPSHHHSLPWKASDGKRLLSDRESCFLLMGSVDKWQVCDTLALTEGCSSREARSLGHLDGILLTEVQFPFAFWSLRRALVTFKKLLYKPSPGEGAPADCEALGRSPWLLRPFLNVEIRPVFKDSTLRKSLPWNVYPFSGRILNIVIYKSFRMLFSYLYLITGKFIFQFWLVHRSAQCSASSKVFGWNLFSPLPLSTALPLLPPPGPHLLVQIPSLWQPGPSILQGYEGSAGTVTKAVSHLARVPYFPPSGCTSRMQQKYFSSWFGAKRAPSLFLDTGCGSRPPSYMRCFFFDRNVAAIHLWYLGPRNSRVQPQHLTVYLCVSRAWKWLPYHVNLFQWLHLDQDGSFKNELSDFPRSHFSLDFTSLSAPCTVLCTEEVLKKHCWN